MELRVAGAQLAVDDSVERNVRSLQEAIEAAAAQGAQILLTPEGSLSGYTHRFDADAVSAGLAAVTDTARARGVGLALGTCFYETPEACYNQIRFYLPDGAYLGFHSKILRCGSWSDPPEGELNDYATTDLRTFDFAGLTVGGLICNDLWANPCCTPEPDPHLTQQLARLGARVVFHAVNGGRDGSAWSRVNWEFHESNLRMRALAGGLWIVTVDSSHPVHLPCSAPSGVISPRGDWVCRADDTGVQLFVHTIDLGD